jgi:NadR type nicotinamide-nucleotide adenylyltransferase
LEERFGFSFVVGKFQPPHLGHNYLIDTALSRSDRVVVCVVDRPIGVTREIPAETRADWLREIHPKAHVIVARQPDDLPDEDSEGWAKFTVNKFGKPDAVFTSEEYGKRWAGFIGCKHVLVDMDRIKFPVSGTAVRNDPYTYWEWMHPIVRSWYVKRVVMLGVESTGKSTLAKILSKHYKTVCVPEYGRYFYEGFSEIDRAPEKWVPADLDHIAIVQCQIEDWMRRKSGPAMICDTDALATQMWHWRYYNKLSGNIESLIRPADLYLVCATDIPFEQDGFRLDDLSRRMSQQGKTISELGRRHLKWGMVTGTVEQRTEQAIREIENLFK